MSGTRTDWRAWLACVAMVLAGCTCSKHPGEEGTGGAGAPEPLGQDSMRREDEEIVLEVLDVSVGGEGAEASRTSFVTGEPITARGRVRNAEELEPRIQWSLQPVGAHTGPATPASKEGAEAVFKASSRVGTRGNREPNPPLEYELVASLSMEDGERLEVRLPPTTFLRQEEDDVLRQEYLDFGTRFQPGRDHISIPGRPSLNTGNYTVIAESEAGGLSRLLDQMEERFQALLHNDVQEKPVGTRGLTPKTVVVSPGAPILTVGALGDTDPQGDDVCSGPLVGGRCAGSILAGPNGIADTRANNRETKVKLEDFVSSAFRNPQRNRAAGSATINSRHTRGSALDIDPRRMPIPGKTPQQLMCIVEAAGDAVVGERDSFTERGATLFLACDSPAADHVHVQR
ncbi:hypothetical protein [Archangium violaceum]|uniref:Peptidase M15A C-terminal domain-containing protein n=1 Tax=Archangium violaceum Cb vi76 TaxID=1406225 RepID=A0A084SFU8_9BACT|nr:hypothetical protein [Archangium violaceum]KFA87333.1 hypothetical protein Q664_48725 [Archangium violaceum Cb vi76]